VSTPIHHVEPPTPETAAAAAGPMDTRRQGLRYLVIGGWNTFFGYATFAALQILLGDEINYLILLTVATILAVLNAYVGYRLFVFRVKGRWLRDLGRFSLVYVVSFLVNLALLPLLVAVVGLPILVAQAILTASTVVMSFFAHRSFSFRRRPDNARPPVT
jgi:putative flippase GtrA